MIFLLLPQRNQQLLTQVTTHWRKEILKMYILRIAEQGAELRLKPEDAESSWASVRVRADEPSDK